MSTRTDVARRAALRTALSTWRRLPRRVRLTALRAGTPRYTVGSLVVLRRGRDGRQEFLLLHQRHTGRWALPGGLLKRGEGALDGALREVEEETGITLSAAALTRPVGVVVEERPRRVDVLFLADVEADATPQPELVEVLAAEWYTLADLPSMTGATRRALLEYAALGLLQRA